MRPPGNVWMLLIEVFLKLGELVQVPVFLPQSVTGIAKLSSTATTTTASTETRRPTAITEINKVVCVSFFFFKLSLLTVIIKNTTCAVTLDTDYYNIENFLLTASFSEIT